MPKRPIDKDLNHSRGKSHDWDSILCYIVAICLLCHCPSIGQPQIVYRTVPPVDPELLPEPERTAAGYAAMPVKQREILRAQVAEIESEVQKAKQLGQPAIEMEEVLEKLRAMIAAWREPEPRSADALPKPALRAALKEISNIGEEGEPLCLEDANHLVNMLYRDIEPRVNFKLQLAALRQIEARANENEVADEVGAFFRSSVLAYYESARHSCDPFNRGALCSPYSMLHLAAAIAATASSDDAEAMQAFNDLRAGALEKCAALGWEREKRTFSESFEKAKDALTEKDEDLHGVTNIAESRISEDDIGRILQRYRRVLRDPSIRVKPETVAIIDRNLLLLAERELNRRNWGSWADTAIAMGPQRASASLREYVATQEVVKDEPKSKEMAKVRRVYSGIVPKP